MNSLSLVVLVFNTINVISGQNGLAQMSQSVCNNAPLIIICDSKETVLINRAIDGVKPNTTEQCQYTTGDCFVDANFNCGVNSSCLIQFYSNQALAQCQNRIPDYRTLYYYCVPILTVYNDICDTVELSQPTATIQSPSYPRYQTIARECSTKIKVPSDKMIVLYIFDVKIKARYNQNCEDYLEIKDSYGRYRFCGEEIGVLSLTCIDEVEVMYKAFSSHNIAWRGAILYYEIISFNGDCASDNRTTFATTPKSTTTSPGNLTNLNGKNNPNLGLSIGLAIVLVLFTVSLNI